MAYPIPLSKLFLVQKEEAGVSGIAQIQLDMDLKYILEVIKV
jgi:hypothetical protein